jgi:hypothetical protein
MCGVKTWNTTTRSKRKGTYGSKLRMLPLVSGNKGIERYFDTESEPCLNAREKNAQKKDALGYI